MKRRVLNLAIVAAFAFAMTSCYRYTATVGTGAQTGVEVKKKNHYMINGLATINQVDPKELAGSAENYTIHVRHKFIDGLIAGLTMGIYTPNTTIVTK